MFIRVLQEESAKPNVHAYQFSGIAASSAMRLPPGISMVWGGAESGVEILPLIGSKEGISISAMTYWMREIFALVPNPGYPSYRSA